MGCGSHQYCGPVFRIPILLKIVSLCLRWGAAGDLLWSIKCEQKWPCVCASAQSSGLSQVEALSSTVNGDSTVQSPRETHIGPPQTKGKPLLFAGIRTWASWDTAAQPGLSWLCLGIPYTVQNNPSWANSCLRLLSQQGHWSKMTLSALRFLLQMP